MEPSSSASPTCAASEWTPLSDYLLVELTEPNRVLPSGIVLPETAVENHVEAIVRSPGVGVYAENGQRFGSEVDGGDVVYFLKHHFESLAQVPGFGPRWGFVRERNVIAWECASDEDRLLNPHNDWLMLVQDASPARAGRIVLPQRARKAPRAGVLVECGIGTPIFRGDLAGRLRPVWFDFGESAQYIASGGDGCWYGDKVYWSAETKRVVIGDRDGSNTYVFIRARDAIAYQPVPSGTDGDFSDGERDDQPVSAVRVE